MLLNEGAIQPEGIRLLLDIENISDEYKVEITQKIIVSLKAAIQSMRKQS